MADVANLNDLLAGHVTLEVECLDRLYLNGYVPNLQVSGQVVTFLCDHRRRHGAIAGVVQQDRVGVPQGRDEVRRGQRRPADPFRLRRTARSTSSALTFRRASEPGVVAIGMAQEFQSVFTGHDLTAGQPGPPRYSLRQGRSRVSVFFFYIWDDEFGPGFIKLCTYFPYPAKVWLNGHEWAKQQATNAGIGFSELVNGFASCEDPAVAAGDLSSARPSRHRRVLRAVDDGHPRTPQPRRSVAGTGRAVDAPSRGVPHRRVRFSLAAVAPSSIAVVADNIGLSRPSEVR